MRIFIGLLMMMVVSPVPAKEFSALLEKVGKHPSVVMTRREFDQRISMALAQSSLKDPMIQISALNVPVSSLSFDRTPMSSRQVMISQAIPLSSRLGYLSDQAHLLKKAGENQVEYQVSESKAQLWIAAAQLASLQAQLIIVDESLAWIGQVDRSTQRLYSTGQTNQINLLEIKVRRSELAVLAHELNYKIAQAKNSVGYLVGLGQPVAVENVPWKLLEEKLETEKADRRELSLEKEVEAAQAGGRAAELALVPDLTIGAAYAFREDVDGQGDFVSAFVQFSLPFWGTSKNQVDAAQAALMQRQAGVEAYRLGKAERMHSLEIKISSLQKEAALVEQAIEFAETERKLATRRFTLGKMGIFDLLKVELKLREKKSGREVLQEQLRQARVELLLITGDDLNV